MNRHPLRAIVPARAFWRALHRLLPRWALECVARLAAIHALLVLLPLLLARIAPLILFALPLAAPAVASTASGCNWREPRRTFPEGVRWSCEATYTVDGDTLRARCDGRPGTVAIRLRGLDTDERSGARWGDARAELRRRTDGRVLAVMPHHRSYKRVVADVLADGVNVGTAMDATGWSKAYCPKR